jgi:phosphatidylglycerophosphate synthase
LCNLMDGMLAVEGKLKTHNGDLFNEFPDRLSDMLILAGLGIAGGTPLSWSLGWLAACGALMTACVRMHGASLLGTHDFTGPMAKPQRMALATGLCLVAPWVIAAPVLSIGLGAMVAGIAITLYRRLTRISKALREKSS